jgi:integrase
MATIYKPAGRSKYIIEYLDENGDRRRKTGATDKTVTERLARDLENRVLLRREGLIDPKAESLKAHESKSLADHLADWQACLIHRGGTAKHADLSADRVRRLAAVMCGCTPDEVDGKRMTRRQCKAARERMARAIEPARLSLLTADKVQSALATFRDSGRSLETCNHYRRAVRGFAQWAWKNGRLRHNPLLSVSGFNAKEDRRHDRRTVSLEELRRLIEAAEQGPVVMGMTGPVRSLCYRLAIATGLRYSEIASIMPPAFEWKAPSVTVAAAYTKNGQTATLPIPTDLADDLRPYVESLADDSPVFPLPAKGSDMLQADLAVAGIPYVDASGLFFDFHALRCQMATNADAAGVTPRVVQKLMRHSTLELTGRYTKPRVVDIEAAARMLPSLRPEGDKPESQAMTGTCSTPVSFPVTPQNATQEAAYACNPHTGQEVMSDWHRTSNSKVVGSNPTGRASVTTRQHQTSSVKSPCFPRVSRASTQAHSNPQSSQQETRKDTESLQVATVVAAGALPSDPDLRRVIEERDRLPEAIRQGIVARVKASDRTLIRMTILTNRPFVLRLDNYCSEGIIV